MPDHQQAAVLALFEKIMGEDPTTPAPVRFALLSDEDKRVFREALAAAEPHLRRKWAAEVREKVNPPTWTIRMNGGGASLSVLSKPPDSWKEQGNEPIHGDYRRPIPR